MDAVALLKHDHLTVEGLFKRYESLGRNHAEERRRIVQEIIRELSVHAAIEEKVLYPEVQEVLADGESLAREALEEHEEAKEVLAELDDMDADEPGFDPKVRSLIKDVRHHVEEEETEMFPKLESAVAPATLNELGQKMENAKKLAPTRPHPQAPDTPPGNLAAGPIAGVADRVRDVISGRMAERETPSPRGRTGGRKKATGRAASRRKSTGRRAVYHVTSDPDGGWKAVKQGASRALARSDSKREVVSRARDAAKRQEGRLVVHNEKGRIQEERTYGSDPRRSRG
jgi:hemerythrin superfamily protein